MKFSRRIHFLHKDEGKAVREYQQAVREADMKRDKLILQSIKKQEGQHKGRLGKILQRMKA